MFSTFEMYTLTEASDPSWDNENSSAWTCPLAFASLGSLKGKNQVGKDSSVMGP